MKILFFYQYFGTPKGSWSTRIYELTRRWVDAGHEVTVVTAPYAKSDITAKGFISKQNIDGINLIVINSGDSNLLSIWRRVLRACIFALVSVYYVFRLRYDVLIASSGPITIGLPLIVAKKMAWKKTVFEVRDLWPAGGIEMGMITKKWQQKLALWFESLCYKSSDIVVAASVGQQKHIQDRFPDKQIYVIPNASDLDLFGTPAEGKLPAWAKGKKLITHIGSLGFIHNMTYWMEVAKALNEIDPANDILVVCIGDGAERQKLEQLKKDWHLERVHFLGLKPKSELPLWVQNSVLTLFATLDNPVQNTCSPNKVFDSFAAGIPVIQTTTGWIYDLIKTSGAGRNVTLSTPTETARLISELCDQPVVVQKMGKAARKLAETRFNRDLLAKEYIDTLVKIGE